MPELVVVSRRNRFANGWGTLRWIEASQRYRLRFKQVAGSREEYFSVTQYGSKRAARGAAEKRRRILAGQVATGRRVVVPRLTVAEQVQAWLTRKRGTPSYDGYVDRAAHVMRHPLGAIPLERLQGQDVSDFYYDLEHEPQPMLKRGVIQPQESWRPLRPKTIKHVAGVLNAALDLAVAQGLMPNGNPTKNERVSPPRVRKRTYDLFDVSEMDRMIEGADGYLQPVLILLCRYGLRPGEALSLRWTDLGATSLTVARSIRDLDTPKTDAGFRTLPVAASDMAALRGWRATVAGSPWLFPAQDGRPTRLQTLNRDFARLLRRLGIRYRRPYDCRHTAITMVIAYTRTHGRALHRRRGPLGRPRRALHDAQYLPPPPADQPGACGGDGTSLPGGEAANRGGAGSRRPWAREPRGDLRRGLGPPTALAADDVGVDRGGYGGASYRCPGRLGCPSGQGVRPLRAHDRHRALRPAGRSGHGPKHRLGCPMPKPGCILLLRHGWLTYRLVALTICQAGLLEPVWAVELRTGGSRRSGNVGQRLSIMTRDVCAGRVLAYTLGDRD